MTPHSDLLAAALESLAGRSPRRAVPAAWRSYAERLRDAVARLDAAPACPAPVLRRVEALFRARPQPAVRRVLRLLFDSWSAMAPATRSVGAPRLLRFGGDPEAPGSEDHGVDVEVERHADHVLLRLAITPRDGTTAGVLVDGAARARAVRLDRTGAGRLRLPPEARRAVVVLRRRGREVLRTPAVPLR
jgi:hypothetical protein